MGEHMSHNASGQRGFTTIELVVVLGLAGVLLAIAGRSLNGMVVRWKTHAAAQDIASAVNATRALAIRTHSTQLLAIDAGGGRHTRPPTSIATSMPTDVKVLPARIGFRAPDTSPAVNLVYPVTTEVAVAFNGRGRLLSSNIPGYIHVANQSRREYYRVAIDMSGAVRVERWNGQWP